MTADAAVRGDIFPFRESLPQPPLNISGIVTIRDKADLLAVRLVVTGKPGLFGNPADLILRQPGKREMEPSQLFLGQAAEHIGLIPRLIFSRRQQHPVPISAKTGIVTGRNHRKTVSVRRCHQSFELDQRIADDAGVRRPALCI